jgi:photosystem II stability/assembly factor-like uncharacterized protein
VPATAFINDIRADLHDADTVYVALDNHKYGDFKPYLLVSRNRGRSWESLAKTLPDRHLVWRLVQDHVEPGLMFIGTEFGVFMTRDAGRHWDRLATACRRFRSATSRSSAARTTWWQRASVAGSSSSMTTRRCAAGR